ncbi:hypothetical protein AVEN_182935-1 [Araneus ventricosus]|uniref:Uncharacterized protein n=1 Tax=Araneus ventricosus TaxID=182803 RepID=A0A4Y2PER4_ARAVE|nr:hypothetical protein AVEN_182935-1 [Araneus ventricosus]
MTISKVEISKVFARSIPRNLSNVSNKNQHNLAKEYHPGSSKNCQIDPIFFNLLQQKNISHVHRIIFNMLQQTDTKQTHPMVFNLILRRHINQVIQVIFEQDQATGNEPNPTNDYQPYSVDNF